MAFSLIATLGLAAAAAPAADLAAFEQTLAAQDSATAALGQWCAARKLADPPVIRALPRPVSAATRTSARIRHLLKLRRGEVVVLRHVDLTCGSAVLSVAWNWYVPARLTPEMNAALAEGNTPFGKVAAPLRFRRVPIATVAGPAGSCPAETISTHRAVLRLPDGKPLAYVVECYTRQNLR